MVTVDHRIPLGIPLVDGKIQGPSMALLPCGCLLLLSAGRGQGEIRVLCDRCSLEDKEAWARELTSREYGPDQPVAYG